MKINDGIALDPSRLLDEITENGRCALFPCLPSPSGHPSRKWAKYGQCPSNTAQGLSNQGARTKEQLVPYRRPWTRTLAHGPRDLMEHSFNKGNFPRAPSGPIGDHALAFRHGQVPIKPDLNPKTFGINPHHALDRDQKTRSTVIVKNCKGHGLHGIQKKAGENSPNP